LRSYGKRVIVASTQDTVARELRNAVGKHFIDLATVRSHIERFTSQPIETNHEENVREEAMVLA